MERGPGVKRPVKGETAPEARRLSPTSVRYCLLVLRMALDRACKLDLVPRNVAQLVDFHKTDRSTIEPFTPSQA
jgi:hypothetical protein